MKSNVFQPSISAGVIKSTRIEVIMKLYNISDIEGFFKVIDTCKGKVELVSNEGDRINLKSKLSQYFSLAKVFSDGEAIELEIIAYEPEDTQKIINFMLKCKDV